MRNKWNRSSARATAAAVAVMSVWAGAAISKPVIEERPPATFVLPAGVGCSFELRIDILPGGKMRTFVDAQGQPVRIITSGSDILFTNTATQAAFLQEGRGSVTKNTPLANGVIRVESTGGNSIILFPTDTPPGPSATLYLGRVVYLLAPGDVFTLLEARGASYDICAELSA